VHESGADPATRTLLEGISDARLRFYSTDEPVPMTENWERALDYVHGDYVIYVGDDDGLLPDSCILAKHFFEAGTAEILSSAPAQYGWPRLDMEYMRSRIKAQYGKRLGFTFAKTKPLLTSVFRFESSFLNLPKVYYSFVSRKLIDRVRNARGRYFFGAMPDVISGVVNCHFADHFAVCNRPIAIGGTSHNSTTYRILHSGDSAVREEAGNTAFGERNFYSMAGGHGVSLALAVGNEYLLAKEDLFPLQSPELDYHAMLSRAAQQVNGVADRHGELRSEIFRIAGMNNIPFESIAIPPRVSTVELPKPRRFRGVREDASGIVRIDLDGAASGVANVLDASLCLARLLPATTRSEIIAAASNYAST
jgi:hypothetical protein